MPVLPGREAKRSRGEEEQRGAAQSRKAARTSQEVAAAQGEDKQYVVPPPLRRAEAQEGQAEDQTATAVPSLPEDNSVWEQAAPAEEAASLDEELDTYFEGMFA